MAPKDTPKAIVDKISNSLKGMNAPEIHQRFVHQGTDPVISTPEALATQIKTDVASYRELIKATGIQID